MDLKDFKKKDKKFFVTHVQRDEINKTPDATRRDELLSIFQEIADSISTTTAFWNISKWNESKWSNDDLAQKILEELNKKDQRKSNPEDALIADTEIKNNYILITEDGPLYEVVIEIFNGSAQNLDDFLNSP